MGTMIELCNCTNKHQVNAKASIENDINNENFTNIKNNTNFNTLGDKKKKKIINIETNNDEETFSNIHSKVVLVPKSNQVNEEQKKEQNIKPKKNDDEVKTKKNSQPKNTEQNKTEQIIIEDKNTNNIKFDNNNTNTHTNTNTNNLTNNNSNNYNTLNTTENFFVEFNNLSDSILSQIVLLEQPKLLPEEKKNKMKGRQIINIIILGLHDVGKSTFCIRFVDNKFEDFYIPSIGVENYSKNMTYNERIYKINFSVIFLEDNLKKYESIFNNSDFIFILFDITKIKSFNSINVYLKMIKNFLFFYDKEESISNFCVIGNKFDLEAEKNVELNLVNNWLSDNKIKYFETSVKTSKNIHNLVQYYVGIFDKFSFGNE